MKKNKKILMLLLASISAQGLGANIAEKNVELSGNNKLLIKMKENIENGKLNENNYKLIEDILNKRNKDLKKLYVQKEYILKPEYLEWQVFFSGFYDKLDKGKNKRDNTKTYAEEIKLKNINLGMVIPVKSLDDKNISLNITSIQEPNIRFDVKPVSSISMNDIDINHTDLNIPDIPNIMLDLPQTNDTFNRILEARSSNVVRYSTSGSTIFENLNLNSTGKTTLDINNNSMSVTGSVDYENTTAGVTGTTLSSYNHTGLGTHPSINIISLDGNYELNGDWEMKRASTTQKDNTILIDYSPKYIVNDSKFTNKGNISISGSRVTGMSLNLNNDIPNNSAKVVLENQGNIVLSGNDYAEGILLHPSYEGYLEGSIINNGIIEINTTYSGIEKGVVGSGIVITMGNANTGKVLVKPGKINVNGKYNSGIIINTDYSLESKDIDSNIMIDGTDGLINIAGERNIGILLIRANGKINSNNVVENLKNLNLLMNGNYNVGIARRTDSDSEKVKDIIIDSSLIQSVTFGDDSQRSSLFQNRSGALIIDSSMSDVFGVINNGIQNVLIDIPNNYNGQPKAINYADINIGSGAKAMVVMYTNTGVLENYGNIVNNSSVYVSSNGFNYGSANFVLYGETSILKNTGNIVSNGDKAVIIQNKGTVYSENDYLIVNGNGGIVLNSEGGYGYDPSTGGYDWLSNNSYIKSNKIEVNGDGGTVFSLSQSNLTLSPKDTNGTLEINANGNGTFGVYNLKNQKESKIITNGNIQMNITNGGVAFGYHGNPDGTILDVYEYINGLVDTSNGTFTVNVDENSYNLSIVGLDVSLNSISKVNRLGATDFTFNGSNKNRLNQAILYIDIDSNMDRNNTIGDKTLRDMEYWLANLITNPDVTISGTEDSLFGMAAGGTVAYGWYPFSNEITNNGNISLTGKENVGMFGKRTLVKNTGNIVVTGENGIGILGRVSNVIHDGSIKIGSNGIGIYSETYLSASDYPELGANYSDTQVKSYLENNGSIVAETGQNAIGIYSAINSANGISAYNEVKLNSGTNIDLNKSDNAVGLYTDKSKVTGTGIITVGKNGYGIYAKDAEVNLTDLELNLFGDNAVGIYTDGTTDFTGTGTINVDGRGVIIFNIASSGIFNQNFQILSSEGSSYVFQTVKNSELFSNSVINLSEGGLYTYGLNSAILLDQGSDMSSYNSQKDIYESNIIGIALSGENFNGIPTIINGQMIEQEAVNKGKMSFGNNSAGIYVREGASALNEGIISLGQSSVGIYGSELGTNINNTGNINIKDMSIGLVLKNGSNIINTGKISGVGNQVVGIYSDTINNSDIINTGEINLEGDRTVGVYIAGSGNQVFKNTGSILTGYAEDLTDPSIGIYNNTSSGVVQNEGLVKVRENGIGVYNKDGSFIQTDGRIETGENGIGIYSDSGIVLLNNGSLEINGNNGIGIYGINGAKIDNNIKIDVTNGNYGIVLQSNSELLNRKSQTLENDGVFVYSDNALRVVNEAGADVLANGSRNVAFYMTNGGDIINRASITANTGEANIGIYNKAGNIENTGDIKVGDSIILDENDPFNNSYSVGIYGEKNSILKNSGNIELGTAGVGLYTRAGGNEALNTGNITSLSESAIGIFADNSSVRNEGEIVLSGLKSIGIAGERNAVITNAGIITMNGGESTGIYANSNSKVINTKTGVININGNNSTGILLSNGSVLENYGEINLASGINGSKDIVTGTSSYTPPSIVNAGVIKVDEKFELDGLTLTIKVDPSSMRVPTLEEIKLGGYDMDDLNSGFLLSNGTNIIAPSFDFGNSIVRIDSSFTQGTNARVYKFENVFDPNTPDGGQNTGLVSMKSISLTFDAIPVVNKSGGIDVWMEKIDYNKFTEGSWQTNFAENIEKNYLNAKGEALTIYDRLDLITEQTELQRRFGELAGDIYANMNQREETISGIFEDSLKILENSENNTKENVKLNIIAGKGSVDENTTGVQDYDYTTAGILALREIERNYKQKFAYSFGYQNTKFDFTDENNSKEQANSFQAGIHNNYKINGWYLKNNLLGKVSLYDTDRKIVWNNNVSNLNGKYETYSITSNNILGKEFSLGKNMMINPYGGIKVGYITRGTFTEKGMEALEVKGNDSWTVKPKIGVELTGSFPLGKNEKWHLKGSLDMAYEYELAGLNKEEKAKLSILENDYHKLSTTKDETGTLKTRGTVGIEVDNRYGVYLTGEYRIGNNDRNDYRAGVSLKAAF